jgi:dynein heavy chain 1
MFRLTFKDVARRRSVVIRGFQFEHEPLRTRLAQVYKFREQHERLVGVFSSVLSSAVSVSETDADLVAQLQEAYSSVVRNVSDVLDISPTGASMWQSSQQLYEKQVERIESKVTRLLEERLTAAVTADEMFRVFSTFNPLFFRPAIKNAVNSFRSTLVKNVQADVRRLQEKFKHRYDDSMERCTADIRDIPPLAGRIIWARQIENQLITLMKRMEDVLGVGWEDHFEGKQLKQVCEELRGYLDTSGIYNEWLQQQLSQSDASKYSKSKEFLLLVDEDVGGKKSLRVNFDDKQVVVFKEVRYLETLLPGMSTAHKSIPHTIRSQAKEAFQRYPVAMALQAALAGFNHAKACIAKISPQQQQAFSVYGGVSASDHGVQLIKARTSLLVSHIQAVRDIIKEAMGGSKRTKRWVKWDTPELNDWVSQLSSKVFVLQVINADEVMRIHACRVRSR